MLIKDFLTEQWMNDHEREARINLTDTSAPALRFADLIQSSPELFSSLGLDYGWITGDPALRKEILSLYIDQRPSTLTMTNGALQGNELVMNVLLSPGDRVITFSPGYQQFAEYPRWLGCNVVELPLCEDDWSIPFDALERELKTPTRLIVLALPSNPTGTWLDRSQLERLADMARRHRTWILCDEVYRAYDDEEVSLSDLYEKGMVSGSLSKLFGGAGIRLGWIKGAPKIIEAVNVFRDYTIISAGPLSEAAALAILRKRRDILGATKALTERNKVLISAWLAGNPYFSCVLPKRGTVSFLKLPDGISSKEFASELLEQTGIFFVPGWCFGMDSYLRLSLASDYDNLDEILESLTAWTKDYLQRKGIDRPAPADDGTV